VGAASDDSVAARPGGPLQKMAFRYSFRKDQRLILGQLEQQTRHAIGGSPIPSCGPSRVGGDDHRPRAHQAIRCPRRGARIRPPPSNSNGGTRCGGDVANRRSSHKETLEARSDASSGRRRKASASPTIRAPHASRSRRFRAQSGTSRSSQSGISRPSTRTNGGS
jgi:hypothetical protein